MDMVVNGRSNHPAPLDTREPEQSDGALPDPGLPSSLDLRGSIYPIFEFLVLKKRQE